LSQSLLGSSPKKISRVTTAATNNINALKPLVVVAGETCLPGGMAAGDGGTGRELLWGVPLLGTVFFYFI
jgi:hypothetical protein